MKKSFRIISILLLFSLLCAISAPVFAEEQEKTVKVAVLNYPNFIEKNADGEVTGYAAEYLSDITDYTGWNYEYIDMPFSTALNSVHNGDIDIVVGVQKATGRDNLFNFSEKSMGENGALLCTLSSDDKYAYEDFSQFEGLSIGAITGSAYVNLCKEYMAKKNVNVTVTEHETDSDAHSASISGEVNALMMGTIRCTKDYKVIARMTPTDMYFACNPKNPDIKTGIDNAQKSIHETNRYYEMTLDKKYFSDVQNSQVFSNKEEEFIKKIGEINLG